MYNAYAVPTLSFLSQLEEPPEETLVLEAKTLRRAAVGPGSWVPKEDFWHLRECYGQARSFRSIRVAALSAQVRVATLDDFGCDGDSLSVRATRLETLEFMGRRRLWRDWYRRSHVLTLVKALDRLKQLGIHLEKIVKEMTIQYRRGRSKLICNVR